MFVALGMQHVKRMRRNVLSSVACPDLQHSSTLSHKRHDFRKKKKRRARNMCSDFLCNFAWNISHSKKK